MLKALLYTPLLLVLITGFTSCSEQSPAETIDQVNRDEIAQESEIALSTGTVDVVTFRKHMSDEGAIVVDVRTEEEVNQGFIPSAIHIEYNSEDMDAEFNRLGKDRPILVYCAGGGRSAKTMTLLTEMGFTTVYDLDGGIEAWSMAKYPIERP